MIRPLFILAGLTIAGCLLTGCTVPERMEQIPPASTEHHLSVVEKWIYKQDKNRPYVLQRYRDCFVGVGIGGDTSRLVAIKKAKLRALAELTGEIKVEVRSMIDRYQREIIENRTTILDQDFFSSIRETYSDVRLRGESYKIQDYLLDRSTHRHYVAIIAYKNRREYFNDYVNLISDKRNVDFRQYINDWLNTLNSQSQRKQDQ